MGKPSMPPTSHNPLSTAARLTLASLALLLAVGCSSPPKPQMRTGSLPFPGLFTLYKPYNAEKVNPHRYRTPPLFSEGSKGIVYTRHGGFIDVAHLRWTVDWGWYYQQRVQQALRDNQTRLTLPTDKFTRFALRFDYPQHWHDRTPAEREQLIGEISLRLGQELAWLLGHWHEMATYYGYATLVVVSEHESAFAYCDTFAHVIGLHVLEDAVTRYPDHTFDEAVTAAFYDHLHSLEPVSVEQTYAAVDAVEGRWWEDRHLLRRQLVLALQGGSIRPWLIPEAEGEPGRYGDPWEVPGLHELDPPYRDFVTIRIKPRIIEAYAIRKAAGIDDGPIDPYEHFPRIIQDIRERHHRAHGPGTTQP